MLVVPPLVGLVGGHVPPCQQEMVSQKQPHQNRTHHQEQEQHNLHTGKEEMLVQVSKERRREGGAQEEAQQLCRVQDLFPRSSISGNTTCSNRY